MGGCEHVRRSALGSPRFRDADFVQDVAIGGDGRIWFVTNDDAGRTRRLLDADACGGQVLAPWNIRRRWPTLATATAWLDGRRITLAHHPSRVPIDLRLHPKGTATVRVVGRLANHRRVTAERTFEVCASS